MFGKGFRSDFLIGAVDESNVSYFFSWLDKFCIFDGRWAIEFENDISADKDGSETDYGCKERNDINQPEFS